MAQNLQKIKGSLLGELQGQAFDKKAARTMALLVNDTDVPLQLTIPSNLVHLQHPLYLI